MTKKPLIAVPLGDPAGIGPEIVVKSLADNNVAAALDCVVIGDEAVVKNACRITGAPFPDRLVDLRNIDQSRFEIGRIDAMCGKASYEYVAKAIELAMAGAADAVATPPINKEALKAAGIPYIGHTEIFAELTGTKDPLTMFETDSLRVFFLSRHVSLRQACDMVKEERIIDYVRRCAGVLEQLGVKDSAMAVAGLNPHSGEHGLFGDEEQNEIVPAVKRLKSEGYLVEGPVSADSVFHLARQGRYSSVLSSVATLTPFGTP